MTVETPETIEVAEQRAELKTVLESKGFVRAPTLANLLAYLCQKLFAGEANQIKEYSIAVEAFRRSDSFDQDSDSIVRVEANRLRRRLAEYYQGEGARNPLQISIPVGQYVPKFARNAAAGGERISADQGKPSPGISVAPRQRVFALLVRQGWWAALSLLILLLAVSYIWRHSLKQRRGQPTVEANQLAGVPPEPSLGPPGGEEVRILAGASLTTRTSSGMPTPGSPAAWRLRVQSSTSPARSIRDSTVRADKGSFAMTFPCAKARTSCIYTSLKLSTGLSPPVREEKAAAS